MTESDRQAAPLSPDEKRALLKKLLQEKAATERAVRPLSYGQRALWYLYTLASEGAAYNVAFSLRIRSAYDPAALQRAVNALIARHASLRTTYVLADDETVQEVAPQGAVTVEVVQAAGLDDDQLRARVHDAYVRPFDLANGPVLRVALFTRSATDHVLLVVIHHIAVDGWSIGLMGGELHELYVAETRKRAARLPAVELSYTDFVAWQQAMLGGAEGDKLRAYWARQLSGELPVLSLPLDRARPTLQTYHGASVDLEISTEMVQGIQELARAEHVTPYTLLLAVFQVLLHRSSGQTDIIVGSPMAGRTRSEFQSVVGYFVNPVALRADLRGDPIFREFLAQTRQRVLEGMAHQDYPFPLLVETLRVHRDPSRSPVFDVLFNLQKVERLTSVASLFVPGGRSRITLDDLIIEPYFTRQEEGQFDLSLDMLESDHGIIGSIKYNTDLFDRSTIERLREHFLMLLAGAIVDPGRRVSELPMMTSAERNTVLVEWNATDRDYPREACAFELFERQVGLTPDAVAVTFQDQSLTYRDLNARVNQLAHHLRGLGLATESLVGLYLERSLEMLIATLAVWKAGGAYVPLDPAFPRERLAYMMSDAAISIVLTQEELRETLPAPAEHVLALDSEWDVIGRSPTTNLESRTTSNNLAYVIYTSGSTGRPKGVQLTHQNLVNFLESLREEPGLTSSDVLVAVTTLSFDIAGLELYLPLIVGARVVIADRLTTIDGPGLAELLERSDATVMQATPATWRLLLDSGWEGRSSLRVFCGGEALPPVLAEALLPRCKELWNLYGPTETTIWSTLEKVEPGRSITVGHPIANTDLYVLDARQQPVPIGVIGELYIGGDGVARGYLHQPELTAQKFVRHPFKADGARLYRTGDLARFRPDSRLEFLGRADFQVKIRGFRIELEEIETLLQQHPAIRQAVVIVREDTPGDQRLVGYLVAGEALPTPYELRTYLRQQLPDYMVPAAFVELEALPLTPNGKIDRRALPKPSSGPAPQQDPSSAPKTEMERQLAEVWCEALKVPQVSVYDNFFDLGGHSLLSVEVIAKMEKRTGLRLNPALMRLQTLGQLATSYEQQRGQTQVEAAPAEGGVAQKLFGLFRRVKPARRG